MKLPITLAASLVLSASSHAAISITIEPSAPGYTTWTLTQTSASPEIDVVNVWGAGGGISLPVSMFDSTWFQSAVTSPVIGDFSAVFVTVSEIHSDQTFLIETFRIATYPGLDFDHDFTLPNGQTTARFEVTQTIPSEAEIDYSALTPGVHTTETMFGPLTVTVIPEPSSAILFTSTALGLLYRRRRH